MTVNSITTRSGPSTARPTILVVLGLAGIIGALMQTMVLPLLPIFPGIFGVSVAAVSWVATSTMLVGAIGAPLLGWLGDRYGLKPMIVIALLLLALGSVVSALADSLAVMLAGRVLQGFSVGIVGLSMAMLKRLWDVEGLPVAVGIISGTIGIGTSLGVPLAGLIVAFGSWQSIFWIMGGGALVAALVIALLVPAIAPTTSARFDWAGATGLGLVLLLILLPISLVAEAGGLTPTLALCLVAAMALAALWVVHQRRSAAPFVDLSLLSHPAIAASHLVALLLGFAFFLSFTGTIMVVQLPAEAGAGLGGSVLLTGIVQTPASLISIVAAPLAGILVMRAGGPRLALALGIGTAIAAFGLRAIDLDALGPIAVSAMLVSGGISFAFAALPIALMSAAPAASLGASNGLNMLCRQMGAATASVVGAIILATSPPGPTAFYWLFGLGAIAGLAAFALVLVTPKLEPDLVRQEEPSS